MRLGGAEPVPMADDEKTFPELQTRLDRTIAVLESVKEESMTGKDASEVVIKTGKGELKFTGESCACSSMSGGRLGLISSEQMYSPSQSRISTSTSWPPTRSCAPRASPSARPTTSACSKSTASCQSKNKPTTSSERFWREHEGCWPRMEGVSLLRAKCEKLAVSSR